MKSNVSLPLGDQKTAATPPPWTQMRRRRRQVLRTQVDALSVTEARDRVMHWAGDRHSHYVVCANAHVVVEAAADPVYSRVLAGADLVTPDGAPVAWMLRQQGHRLQQRVSGPELMWQLLGSCAREGVPVYFFGGSLHALRCLTARVAEVFPALIIAGAESPPFRALSEAEDRAVVQRINQSGARLVFVGLGCPKQERWMAAHRGRIQGVMLGVGAAFDFHAGVIKRAPAWMRQHGLEWLHRLVSEPRRLWRRYLLTNSAFLLGAARQLLAQRLSGR